MTFNDPAFIAEFLAIVKPLNVKTALEVGCLSGELKDALAGIGIKCDGIDLNPQRSDVTAGDFMDYQPQTSYDLVFSSGVLEHYTRQDAARLIRHMAEVGDYVLNLVPNSECGGYMKARSETKEAWGKESPYALPELIQLHTPFTEVVDSGYAGYEWSRRFGGDGSQPYLVWVLGRKPDGV